MADRGAADRRVNFQYSPPPSPENLSDSGPVHNKQLSPSTGSLRARRFPPQRVMCADGSHHHYSHTNVANAGGSIVALARLESQELFGIYSATPSLQHRHSDDAIVTLMGRPSLDSVCELLSNASPSSQAAASAFSVYASKDNVAVQDYGTLPSHLPPLKNVAVIYPHSSSLSDAYSRGADMVSAGGISATRDNANEDRVKVRVEGYYENNGVGVLIPNDLPPSTLLYVLTASDGRDLMFKLIQYSLQLTICFLKTPSLFSPEAQALMGRTAERLYRNYNTIRHGRSLFKMGRGFLNLFTVQTVCERMWMKYKRGIARATGAVVLPVVSCLEKGCIFMGASPLWGRYLSCRLLRWMHTAHVTPGQGCSEEAEGPPVLDWRIRQCLHDQSLTPWAKETPLSGGVCTAPVVEQAEQAVTAAPAASGGVARLKSLQGDSIGGGCAASPKPMPSWAAVDTETNMSRVHLDQPPPTKGNGAASNDEGELSRLPRVPSGGLSAEDWGGRTCETATAAPTPSANSKHELGDPCALPCVPTGPTAHSTSTSSSAEEGTAAPRGKSPHVTGTSFLSVELHQQAHQRHGLATTDWVDNTGRKTLLHPLKQSSSINTCTSTKNSSITGDDGREHLHEGVEGSITHNGTPLIPAARSPSYASTASPLMPELVSGAGLTPADGPLSVPNNWHIVCAPTVPPSRSDEVVVASAPPFSSVELLKPLKRVGAHSSADTSTSMQSAIASSVDNTGTATYEAEQNGRHVSSLRDSCTLALPASQLPVTAALLPASEESPVKSTRAAPAIHDSPTLLAEKGRKASDISILSSRASSCSHERQGNHVDALSTCLREMQPASAALPARWRKGALQFNAVLMTLLGIRNLAAACRRFLRDITLVSTERFGTLRFVEVHRHIIAHIINRCWLVVSIIDLLLNTVRLLRPGWVKYATARQNIHCRCGCYGDDNTSDKVWRTHGLIARRKSDLFFPPLDLDYGAPFVSSISYVEAADPAHLMPACRRCGCLYREILTESDEEKDEADAEAVDASGGISMSRSGTLAAMSKAAALTASSFSEDDHLLENHHFTTRKSLGASGLVEREKPRWVQLYKEEAMLAVSQQQQQQQRLRSPGARREKQYSCGEEQQDSPEEQEKPRSYPLSKSSAGHEQSADEMRQRGKSGAARERASESSAGILFVPWIMRKFFDYVWLLRVHPNLTSTVLLEARCIAELYLAYKYCFGNFETFMSDAPLSAILNPYGALAGIVSASVGLLRVIESAPSS
ncbi:hypothetical protein, conserved [Leishmania tarentolae]|uniref:Uncharacterized protein n=1 Tax=Leishmania tarentolae TaxID=5689 RepID=A0A640KAY1_LEITA|nr:hypothetical protein, conserved [Leishmania tarentolae]